MQDRGKYGQITFRRVVELVDDSASGATNKAWCVESFSGRDTERFSQFLNKKFRENGEAAVYMSCDFGKTPEENRPDVTILNERQQEYIRGIAWKKERMYHKVDQRMREILMRMYEKGKYRGVIYFLGSHVKVEIR